MSTPGSFVPPEVVPDELRRLRRWVVWKLQRRKGSEKPTKVPYRATLGGHVPASSTNPNTWSSYTHAVFVAQRGDFDGVGFVFAGDGIVGVDLDGARDPKTGVLAEWAREIVDRLGSFTEVSPSGKGVHIFLHGKIPGARRRKGPVEVYEKDRYFTFTGRIVPGAPMTIARDNGALEWLYRTHLEPPADTRRPQRPAPSYDRADDTEVLERMFKSKHGERNRALWEGRWKDLGYPSQSEADLALANALATFTGGDLGQMDRLFRRSGLMRPKWDRVIGSETYGEKTLKRALGS